jgi:flagellar biosynthesis chaperone FliJ
MGKSISEIGNEWRGKVTSATTNFSNNLNDKLSSKVDNMFGGPSDGITDIPTAESFHINPVEFRSKLEVECPDFLKQCNICKLDFGKVFLRPQDEVFIAKTENMTNDVIRGINGAQQYLSPAALESVQNLIKYIITDLVNTVVNYCTNIFLKYTSPEFPIGLAGTLVKKTANYTVQYTKTPDEILAKLCKEMDVSYDDLKKKAEEEAQKTVIGKINTTVSNVTKKINEIMNQIEPYVDIISDYLAYGPDYVCSEVAGLYNKYLDMGIAIVNENVIQIDRMINEYVDSAALSGGLWAAELANKSQEKAAKNLINATEKGKALIKLKAKSLVNKAIMNLLALLGG